MQWPGHCTIFLSVNSKYPNSIVTQQHTTKWNNTNTNHGGIPTHACPLWHGPSKVYGLFTGLVALWGHVTGTPWHRSLLWSHTEQKAPGVSWQDRWMGTVCGRSKRGGAILWKANSQEGKDRVCREEKGFHPVNSSLWTLRLTLTGETKLVTNIVSCNTLFHEPETVACGFRISTIILLS